MLHFDNDESLEKVYFCLDTLEVNGKKAIADSVREVIAAGHGAIVHISEELASFMLSHKWTIGLEPVEVLKVNAKGTFHGCETISVVEFEVLNGENTDNEAD